MLSAIIIARNEEKNIARAVESLAFADEIIVVDSGSTDNTVKQAQQAGARIFVRDWTGYGPQKNFGMQQARGDWVLFVDADEEVPPPLANSLKEMVQKRPAPYNLYWLRIVTVFLGKPLRHLFGHNPRLFRKTFARWTSAKVHEQVQRSRDASPVQLKDPDTNVIPEPLLHHSHQTISSYLKTMHSYTTLDAEQMFITGRHRSGRPIRPSFWLPVRLSIKQFLKLMFYRRGILDSWQGWVWCCLSAYYEYEMAKKYLQLCA